VWQRSNLPADFERLDVRFRLRSSSRDGSADIERLQSIERATLRAIAEAKTEKHGLELRTERAANNAAMLMGNDAIEYLDREPQTEELLLREERTILAAGKRIQELAEHLDHLHKVLALLRQK
jgi:hypothetical protein